jgi:hypothetical protein
MCGRGMTRVAIFRQKKFSAEYRRILKRRQFRQNSAYLRKRNTSELRSEPFSEEKNPRNSVPNHFSEEKNPCHSLPNQFWMRKTSEFCSEPFLKRKNLGIPFRIIFAREKISEFPSESILRKRKHSKIIPNHFWQQKTLGERL